MIAIALPMEKITEFCDRWQITEFALFGSVLRDDFRDDSDIDILVTFAPTAQRGLTETLQMRDELQAIFGGASLGHSPHCDVDLIVTSTSSPPFAGFSAIRMASIALP
jgi:predicted nucleotidyltransferase